MSRLLIVPMNGKSFGATVTGADIMSLTDTEFATVHDALIQHGFLKECVWLGKWETAK